MFAVTEFFKNIFFVICLEPIYSEVLQNFWGYKIIISWQFCG